MTRPIEETPAPPVAHPDAEPAAEPVPENTTERSQHETERRDRVVAAIGRFESRPKRPSWWGRR